jgi:hypothetical protein
MMTDWIEKEQQEKKELRALYQSAASSILWPRVVKVRFREPYDGTLSGTVSRGTFGTYFIDLNPSLDADQTYRIFLHELAHVLDDSHRIAMTPYHSLQPGGKVVTAEDIENRYASPGAKEREQNAEKIATRLEDYASTNAHDFVEYDKPIIYARLKALIAAGPMSRKLRR